LRKALINEDNKKKKVKEAGTRFHMQLFFSECKLSKTTKRFVLAEKQMQRLPLHHIVFGIVKPLTIFIIF